MFSQLLAFGFGPQEMLIMAAVLLLLFGSTRLPRLMRSIGQSVGEFQQGMKDKPIDRKIEDDSDRKLDESH